MSPGTWAQFEDIVLKGIYASRGMTGFSDVLDESDSALLRAYITSRAIEDRAEAMSVQVEGGEG